MDGIWQPDDLCCATSGPGLPGDLYMLAALECRDLRRQQADFFLLDQGIKAHLHGSLTDRDFLQMAGGGLNEEQRQVLARFMQAALADAELLGLESQEVERLREAVAQWGEPMRQRSVC